MAKKKKPPTVGMTTRWPRDLHDVTRDYTHKKRISINRLVMYAVQKAMSENWPK